LASVLAFLSGFPRHARIQTEMKILLTSDIHLSLPWFEWLIAKSPAFDLVCIAADFLDLFSEESKSKQVAQVQGYLRDLASKTNVALCSGNHDSFGRIVPAARGPTYPWLVELDNLPSVISDGQTRIVGDFIVTTLPYCANADAKRIQPLVFLLADFLKLKIGFRSPCPVRCFSEHSWSALARAISFLGFLIVLLHGFSLAYASPQDRRHLTSAVFHGFPKRYSKENAQQIVLERCV
jgi:Calcineurin-like phosphoesterase